MVSASTQATALVLHSYLETCKTKNWCMDVQGTGYRPYHNSELCSFVFLEKSKTYLAEARLTWHKARLKLFLHILCSISTLLMWQPC